MKLTEDAEFTKEEPVPRNLIELSVHLLCSTWVFSLLIIAYLTAATPEVLKNSENVTGCK